MTDLEDATSPKETLADSAGTATVNGDVVNESDADTDECDADEAESDGSQVGCDTTESDETGDIDAHYERLTPVVKALGESDGAHTLGVHDHHGWYRKKDASDVDLIDEGYDKRARPYDLVDDADEFLSRIDRHYYAVLNYQSPEVLRDGEPCQTTEDGTEWRDEKPLPDYSDLRALTLFVDIDLRDEHKERPLSDEKRATFEDVIRGFVEEFSDLVGDDAHVFALDSVGGAYVFVRPQVTAPIADEFDGEERGWIFEELASRVRRWIGDRADEVIQEADAADLCKADLLVNVNRQYKAPLSLHKSIDGVVHPLETEGVTYDFVPFDAVDDALIDETVEWCDDFTAPVESDDATEDLVGTLFSDFEGETWRDRLGAFVSARREEERERQERAERAARRRAEREAEGADFENAEVTPHYQDVEDAVDDIDVAEVVRKYASDAWDTSTRSGETAFNPSWRKSESGESCAVDSSGDSFVDNACNGGGGAAKAYALGRGILSAADEDLEGTDWWRAVDGLRSEGYGIPVWVPEKGTPKSDGDEFEETPYWALKKAAAALGVLDGDEFVEKETDEGSTYEGFPDADAYNATLDALEEEGIQHGRKRADTPEDVGDGTTPPSVDLVEADGGYGYVKYGEDGTITGVNEVTNFTLETDARVEHADDSTKMFKLTVVPRDGEPYQVDVEPKAFNSRDKFESEVVTGFSTWFRGRKKALTDLRELVAAQETEVLEGTELIGMNADGTEFVTPSGTLDEDGWMDEPKTVHVERGVDVERKWSLTPDDSLNDEDVNEVLRLLPEIRPADRFLTVLGWFYAAPLEPRFLEDWTGEYPLLSITGDTGAGKTSTLSVLWRAFGMDDEPLNMDMSPFSQLSSFSSSRGVPVWFDEYRPADINPRRVDKFHDLSRKTTRGATDSRGNADRTTDTYRIKSPVVVSGEQQFQDAALRRRSVLVHFQTGVADEGTDTKRAYTQLVGESFEDEDGRIKYPTPKDLRAHAYHYYTWLLGRDADELEAVWRGANEDAKEVLEQHNVGGLDNSERTALAVTLFGMRLYQRFAEARGVTAPIDADAVDSDVEDALLHAAENATGGEGRRRSHLDDFIELVGYAAKDGYLEEGEHYKLIRDGEVLRFNLSRAHPKIRKYHVDHDLNTSPFEVSEYRNRMKDKDGGYVEKVSQNTPPISRAVGIYLDAAAEVVDIDASMFGGGDMGPQHPVPLNTVEEDDRTTVTVEVWDERDVKSDNVAQVGTLEDATGRVGFVVWDNGDGTPTLEPEKCYRVKNAKVGTFDGDTQIQIDDATDVEETARGTGWLTPEDAGDNERLSQQPQLVALEELRDDEGLTKDELVERVEAHGVDEDEAEAAVETLVTEGVVLENGGLRLT